MADQLRDLIDLVLESVDQPGTSGPDLAGRASFSRDHLDRLLSAATGETPVRLRRRLLLERAAWQIRVGRVSAADAGLAADYGSPEAFSRAFTRAYGITPAAFADSELPVPIEAPNGIHFLAPAGLLIPGARGPTPSSDLSELMVRHHLGRVRELLEVATDLDDEQLSLRLRPGLVILEFEGEEASAADLAERLVYTLEVWVAAIDGQEIPPVGRPGLTERFEVAAKAFERIARSTRDEGSWDDAFVDALCDPPQSFTFGGVISHVLTFGAIRREHLASVLIELGATVPDTADPIMWEAGR